MMFTQSKDIDGLATGTVLLAGASGYIGTAVLSELLARGYQVIALYRNRPDASVETHPNLRCETVDLLGEKAWPESIDAVDTVISCIASRTGSPRDAEAVDFKANLRLLELAEHRRVRRFMLLSAICVQKPRLAFQHQKLRFEAALRASSVPHTIVRPTAFFKSLSGQVHRVRAGKPFLLFDDGLGTACKPISEADLARFMVDRMEDPGSEGAVLPIGGPGPAITPIDQARMLFELLGRRPKTRSVSPRLFDLLHGLLKPVALLSAWGREKAEYMRIAKYYATESMLVWDPIAGCYDAAATPETGTDTLEAHYRALLDKGQADD